MTINERIGLLLKDKDLTANEFASKLSVRSSNISHIITGRNKPSFDFLEKLAAAFPEVNTSWLLKGQGAMYTFGDQSVRAIRTPDPTQQAAAPKKRVIIQQGSLFDQPLEQPAPMEPPFNPVTEEEVTEPVVPVIKVEKEPIREVIREVRVEPEISKVSRIILYFDDGTFEEYLPR